MTPMLAPSTMNAMWRLNEAAAIEALQQPQSLFLERLQHCDYQFDVRKAKKILAFALGISAGQAIEQYSYQWFMTRFDDFVYLDRIVVDASLRRSGLGAGLLASCLAKAQEDKHLSLVCQVHDRPNNAQGHAFVQRMGFHAIESVMLPSREIVTMYQRSIAIATP